VEKRFSGREVQEVHMRLGRRRCAWPIVGLPDDRGAMTVLDVLAASEGVERDAAIDAWCECVWTAYRASRQAVLDLLREYGIS